MGSIWHFVEIKYAWKFHLQPQVRCGYISFPDATDFV